MTAQIDVFSLVNHPHPATAELAQNAIMRDGLTDHRGGTSLRMG